MIYDSKQRLRLTRAIHRFARAKVAFENRGALMREDYLRVEKEYKQSKERMEALLDEFFPIRY